jgi:hypothetical protein
MALTDPWSGEDDDTGYDYYDTPSGNIWRPDAGPPLTTTHRGRASAGPQIRYDPDRTGCAAAALRADAVITYLIGDLASTAV